MALSEEVQQGRAVSGHTVCCSPASNPVPGVTGTCSTPTAWGEGLLSMGSPQLSSEETLRLEETFHPLTDTLPLTALGRSDEPGHIPQAACL